MFQYYPDKSRCYECGETGHLSYKCQKNLLGEREPPPKKIRKRKKKNLDKTFDSDKLSYFDSSDEDDQNKEDDVVEDLETLSAAIALEV